MDAISTYSVATLAWLGLQGLTLTVWPSFVVSLLTVDYHVAASSLYFARALGLAQLGLGLNLLVLSGVLPLTPAAAVSDVTATAASTAPYANASVLVTTVYHAAAAFYSYGCYYHDSQSAVAAYAFGCFGSTLLAALGLWCLLFGSDGGHISRRTGADKRTSGFPFANAAAAAKHKAK